eukprot:CAMPEP_0202829932 /NCGR_PEP_ID=MMETSP1389-20130828/15836_1 /ASSEMBLY_ACC=CAM_ASM_000865 /TAXON_ID=302021 /ORGANISM="Rhodomonas sp., Strain CCMP768" /LENGTH=63 /DNA_ID=CAMNT_0049503523 /DNA_START=34 /DNA_END=225 /DNA_ORIENTATION=+
MISKLLRGALQLESVGACWRRAPARPSPSQSKSSLNLNAPLATSHREHRDDALILEDQLSGSM